MEHSAPTLVGIYDYRLVTLSVLIAVVASYAARALRRCLFRSGINEQRWSTTRARRHRRVPHWPKPMKPFELWQALFKSTRLDAPLNASSVTDHTVPLQPTMCA